MHHQSLFHTFQSVLMGHNRSFHALGSKGELYVWGKEHSELLVSFLTGDFQALWTGPPTH